MDEVKEILKTKPINRQYVWDLLSLTLVVLFPVAYLYFRNLTLVNPREVLITLLIFFACAVVVLIIAKLFLGSISKGAFLAGICMLMIMLFRPLELNIVKLLPFVYYWHLVYIFITLIILIGIFILKKANDETIGKFNKIIVAIFGFLVVTNVLMAVPSIIKELQKRDVVKNQEVVEQSGISNNENVYLLIFDEFSGQDALLRYTGFDNTPFYEKLTELGFNVSPHSRNYTTNTNIELTNLLNLSLSLTNENYSISARDKFLREPALFSLFKQKDYFVNVIDDQTMIPIDAEGIDRLYVGQSNLAKAETFQLVMFKQSAFYPYFVAKEGNRAQEIDAMFDEIINSSYLQDQNMLTVGYFMFPHLPWVVDENGNQISASERDNWKNPNAYLGQFKYVCSRILETVEGIIQNDPDAIIILLSDHAYRLPAHLEDLYDEKIDDRELEYDYQRNILNAVYYKGDDLDIEGLSGVNTLNLVLNTHFSINLPYVEPKK